ncbi:MULTISPECIES: hypothetical protein [Halococcus]|uniref:Uncharacterized protein n=1 Tax=Halococcus salifodinae DSM 8989 TaxID=1227456 RepID=M0MVJ7_9EURY|nr:MULTISPECIES: hypothetical protein [Halococcus]EMA49358.1 hypothetical protein C450_17622 [Halococcus salifodinae DSM 8989]
MSRADIGRIVESERSNARLGWVLIAFIAVVAAANLLEGDLLGAGFAASIVALVSFPSIAFGSPRAMLPWEVLAVVTLPMIGRTIAPPMIAEVATYLGVAAIALVIAVELHLFTTVEMSYRFAVVFVVITTIATAGIWAVTRWIADLILGTGFLVSEDALMWEFVASTVAGIGAGIVFEWYVRRRLDPARFAGGVE